VDYTLRGEWEGNSQVSGPDDPWLADVCGSHAGALPLHKVRTNGADMVIAESTRLFQQNLWGAFHCNVVACQDWAAAGLPHWRARQQEYADSPDFSMALDWPPAWWHELSDASGSSTPTSLTVSFTTPEPTYGELRVVYNDLGYYHFNVAKYDQILVVAHDCVQSMQHEITVSGLEPGREYRVLVRGHVGNGPPCAPDDMTMQEDIYGTVLVVSTPPGGPGR